MITESPAPVTSGTMPVERLKSQLPTFCEPVLKEDDPTQAIAIDFWPAKLNDCFCGENFPLSDGAAYELGDLFGQETAWFIRHRHGPALLGVVLMWMGERLQIEQRCPGPLERGFLDHIKRDCPDAVDWVVMQHFQQHPEQLN
jgi:hypothetical protein